MKHRRLQKQWFLYMLEINYYCLELKSFSEYSKNKVIIFFLFTCSLKNKKLT